MNRIKETEITGLFRLSESLYLFKSSCHVWIVRRGSTALLIDSGTDVPDAVFRYLGISRIDLILHTRLDRSVCAATARLQKDWGGRAAVPASCGDFAVNPDFHWENQDIYHSYCFKPGYGIPVEPFDVKHHLQPDEEILWEDLRFKVINTESGDESLIYRVRIDGSDCVFTGNLLAGKGSVWNFYDMERWYNELCMGGESLLDRAIARLQALESAGADLLLTAHGDPVLYGLEAAAATREALQNTRNQLYQNTIPSGSRDEELPGDFVPVEGSVSGPWNIETSWFFISESGKVLIWDFGWPIMPGDSRDILTRLSGISGRNDLVPDVILFSHYHDDHISGVPSLKEFYPELSVWSMDTMADILENPFHYNLPCLGSAGYPYEGISVDKVLKDRETFNWEGQEFQIHHFPGQTEYHAALVTEMDGRTILFAGDSVYKPLDGYILRGESSNGWNICLLGEGKGYSRCARVLKEVQPDYLASAHHSMIPVDSRRIEEYGSWAQNTAEMMENLVYGRNANFSCDPGWASFYPFRSIVDPGERFQTSVRIRNHEDRTVSVNIRPVLPEGWGCSPAVREGAVPPGETGEFLFEITAGAGTFRRTVLTAHVVCDGIDYGQHPVHIADSKEYEKTLPAHLFEKYRQEREAAAEQDLCYQGAWKIRWSPESGLKC
ncbi:MAG: MBL fold metallo-hydrolase [Spirochaetales bacterium]|nr:MBL fold metallo-hydrolase [Spirochaetales bacterium]